MKQPKRTRPNTAEQARAAAMDELAEFQEFKETLLPALRKDLKSGMSAEDIYKKYQSVAAARNIQIAMTETSGSVALAAIRDILDRTQGKAVERSEQTHKFQNLKPEQLDALLKSKLGALNSDDTKDETPDNAH